MSVDFDISTLDSGHVLVVPKGELDLAQADTLTDIFECALNIKARVIVDLGQVEFMDSTALTVLVRANLQASRQGGWLTLVSVPKPTERLLMITQLDQMIATEESVPAAIAQWEAFDAADTSHRMLEPT